MPAKKTLVLMILDGWGHGAATSDNAIAAAHKPQWDEWLQTCPNRLLEASGHDVGLPDDQMGNSEVGHMHIGAGRVIYQDLTRINKAILDGSFAKNPVLTQLILNTKGNLHVMGLLSNGGVHSHENHLLAFLSLCDRLQFNRVCLHLFTDGRDTPPQSALTSLSKLETFLKQHPVAQIVSISGRYFAMDRDQRWERIQKTWDMMTGFGETAHFDNAQDAIEAYYGQDVSDEFIPPTRIGPTQTIHSDDSIFFFNFRADRARQLTEVFLNPDFKGFVRQQKPHIKNFVSMTFYGKHLPTLSAFPPVALTQTLGEVAAKAGLKQLRIAETEKYAHVTFFFNGGTEQVFENEDRILIPSPKVATYDLMPEMSAPELTEALIKAIESGLYDLIICNYANADMVGHSGNFAATVKAIECLDRCMHQINLALKAQNGHMLITADHGNAEVMFNSATGQAHTAHTSEPVPFIFTGHGFKCRKGAGTLADIAPTVLTLLELAIPTEMSGTSLLVSQHD